jgi:hypothetical protein
MVESGANCMNNNLKVGELLNHCLHYYGYTFNVSIQRLEKCTCDPINSPSREFVMFLFLMSYIMPLPLNTNEMLTNRRSTQVQT